MKSHGNCRSAGGYALMAALLTVFAVSLAASVAVRRAYQEQQRERELELLFVGQQYREALGSFAAVQRPGGQGEYPKMLDDLVLDKRGPSIVRHLRRIYPDPMTGKADWLLDTVQGRIVGVHSRSDKAPIRTAGFPDGLDGFAIASSYRDWRFLAKGIAAAPGAATADH